jgi:hypothetical protein
VTDAHLDRRLSNTSAGVTTSFDGSQTIWTLPYSVATDGSQGALAVYAGAPAGLLQTSRPAPNQIAAFGNYTGAPVSIGVLYTFSYTPTRIYLRGEGDAAETGGRLQLRWVDVRFTGTTDLSVTSEATGRQPLTRTHASETPAEGAVRVSLMARNDTVRLNFTDTSPGPCAVYAIDWEGYYHARSKRV